MKLSDIFQIIRRMGLPWFLYRGTYELRKKTGLLRIKFPSHIVSDEDFLTKICTDNFKSKKCLVDFLKTHKNSFIFSPDDLSDFGAALKGTLSEKEKKRIIQTADNAIRGKILCFSRWTADYGHPINWHLNPVNGYQWPKNVHWAVLEELSNEAGDVKYVWEASRFPHFYYFVRAYALTGDEKYAEAYWRQIENWIEENPYQMGINWKCGQEITFRVFAWLFGLYAFLDSPHTTDDRVFKLIKNIYYSTIRVEGNINYAIKAVQNNHAISEAACLFTIGVLFPFFRDSDRFLEKGKRYLEQEGMKQIYEDGSYIQHSMNYHRLMLQVYAWCWRLAQINGVSFSNNLKSRLVRAIEFLYQMQDENSGKVPNYGANDGALVFPLSTCGYLDYRPQLNAINYIINGKRLYPKDKYDEELMWFCGLGATNNSDVEKRNRTSINFDIGGYYTLRGNNSFAMVRCTSFKNRPGHADMLHVDLWYKGVNILTDIGSYSYNPEKNFRHYFGATRNHNTLTVNNMNQSRRGPRFLTLDWPEGILNEFVINKEEIYFSGYHTAFKNFIHTRRIEYTKNRYIITDQVESNSVQEYVITLNWNLGTDYEIVGVNKCRLCLSDDEWVTLEIISSAQGNLVIHKANKQIPAGWKSLYYGELQPLNQLSYEIQSGKKIETIQTIIR